MCSPCYPTLLSPGSSPPPVFSIKSACYHRECGSLDSQLQDSISPHNTNLLTHLAQAIILSLLWKLTWLCWDQASGKPICSWWKKKTQQESIVKWNAIDIAHYTFENAIIQAEVAVFEISKF